MNNSNSFHTRLKTISNKKINIKEKNSTLRQLQLSMLNSLSKNQIVTLRRKCINGRNQDYDNYINKINNSLSKYQTSFSQDKSYEVDNNLGPNEKFMDK